MAEETTGPLETPENNELECSNINKDSPVTPQNFELIGSDINKDSAATSSSLYKGSNARAHPLRASIGSYRAGESSARISIELLDSPKSSPKKVPHYLRASTGSCHDFCKYGKGHTSEEKPRSPLWKRVAKPLSNELNPLQIIVSGERKKEKVVKHKLSTDSKNHSPDLKPSPVIKSYSPKSRTTLNKVKFGKQNPSKDIKEYLDKEKAIKLKPVKNIKDHSPHLEPSPEDTKFSLPEPETSFDEEKVVKNKPSIDIINDSPDLEPSAVTKSYLAKSETSLDTEKIVKHKPSADIKKRSPYQNFSDTKSNPPKPKTFFNKEKVVKLKPSKDTKDHSPDLNPLRDNKPYPKPRKSLDAKTYSSRQNDISGDKALLRKYKTSAAKEPPSPDPPEIIKTVTEVEILGQNSLSDNKMTITEEKTDHMSKEHSSPVKSKQVSVKSSPSSDSLDGIRGKGRRNSDIVTGRKMTTPRVFVKKTLKTPAATLSPGSSLIKTASTKSRKTGNLKLVVSPLKNRNRLRRVDMKTSNNEKVLEKTLHVIMTEIENNVTESTPDEQIIPSLQSPSSPQSLSHANSSSSSSYEEEVEEMECEAVEAEQKFISETDMVQPVKEKVKPTKENNNKTLRKGRASVSEDKYSSPAMLKFRSGKTVDIQSDNNNRPRRLRFRRSRVLGPEEVKGDLRRRTLKKAEVDDNAAGAELSSKKVVLKHQDVQDKKDAQGLLNNVIEKTASELAESRKSKVKALVGAFETVISLQETKPSVQAVS